MPSESTIKSGTLGRSRGQPGGGWPRLLANVGVQEAVPGNSDVTGSLASHGRRRGGQPGNRLRAAQPIAIGCLYFLPIPNWYSFPKRGRLPDHSPGLERRSGHLGRDAGRREVGSFLGWSGKFALAEMLFGRLVAPPAFGRAGCWSLGFWLVFSQSKAPLAQEIWT